MNRAIVAFVMLLSCPALSAAQNFEGGIRGIIGLQTLGVDLEISTPHAAAYARTEGFPLANRRIHTIGARVWPFGHEGGGLFAFGGYSAIRCSRTSLGGGPTGCDAEWHESPTAGVGVDIGHASSRWGVFMEGSTWLKDRDLEDVPDWSAAAGVRYVLR